MVFRELDARSTTKGGYYAVSSAFNFYEKKRHDALRVSPRRGFGGLQTERSRVRHARNTTARITLRTTEAGEEWVRCSKRLPHRPWRGYNGRTIMLDPDDLERSWIDCGANRHGDDPFGFEGRVAEREDAATAPPRDRRADERRRLARRRRRRVRTLARGSESRGEGGRFRSALVPRGPRDAITGRYSPAQRCFRGESVTVGGSPHACDQAGYERSLPDGTVRRYVTPTWDNSKQLDAQHVRDVDDQRRRPGCRGKAPVRYLPRRIRTRCSSAGTPSAKVSCITVVRGARTTLITAPTAFGTSRRGNTCGRIRRRSDLP